MTAPARPVGMPPRTVRGAFGLMLLRVVLSLVGLVVTLADYGAVKRKILEKSPTASPSTVDRSVTIGIVLGAVVLVFYLALCFLVRGGYNWARIVTWVFAAFGVIQLITSLSQPTIGVSRALGVLDGLIDIAIIVLLARAPSNAYFRQMRQPR